MYATAFAVADDDSPAAAEAAGFDAATATMRGRFTGGDGSDGVPDVLLVSGFPAREECVLKGVSRVYGSAVPVFGGSAADDDLSGNWWMLASDDVVRPRCAGGAGVLLTALRPTVQVAITLTALHAQTRRSGVVTKAGADGRTIVEIDGRPAASVYDEWSDGALGYKAALGSESDVGGACNILSESTLYPLAREIQDGDGLRVHHLLHPAFTYPDGSLSTFADVREGETLLMMRAKAEGLVSAVGGATSKALAWAGPGFERPSGAMVIYCAGCFLATRPHISAVAESIRRGLSGGGDGGGGTCPPFVGAFTYGEQGPIGENTHANLMYNVLAFGGPKPHSGGEDASKEPLSARELAGRSVSETAAIAAMREQAKQRGDAALVERLDAAAAAAAAEPRGVETLVDELRELLLHGGVYGSLLQLFSDLDASGLSKVRLPDFHAHLTARLGFRVSDEEWAALAEFLDADGDGTLSYREIFALLQAGSPKGRPPESPTWGRSASRGRM